MIDAFLAIDIGTQSSRAAILDEDGVLLELASQPHDLQTPRAGWAEQHPDDWWQATTRNVREVVTCTGGTARIAAIAVCGQMHGTVPIGAHGELLADAVQLWCDKRAADIADEVAAEADLDDLLRMAGNVPTAAWSGFKMAWMRRHQPEVYDKAQAILTPKDYVNFRLTGEIATDCSEASGSFLMDARSGDWSPELIALLGLDAAKLPPIRRSAEVIGGVTAEAAALTGLLAGTPVVAGSGDMLCQLLGAGITTPGMACDTSGTASIISFHAPAPVADRRMMNLHAAGPHWIAFGILDSGGGALRWWRDQFVATPEEAGDDAYARMLHEAEDVPPGCEGLLFFPYLLGERTLGSADSRGVFFGLHARHGRAHGTRAIVEGITCELRQSLEIVREAGVDIHEMHTGGGGARSVFWSQLKADIYGMPVTTIQHEEVGILGAAMLAGVGAGVYASEGDAAARLIQTRERFTPNPALTPLYDQQYDIFHELHDALQPSFKRLSRLDG